MDPVGSSETLEIVPKHLEVAPKEIVGGFPRFDKKETNELALRIQQDYQLKEEVGRSRHLEWIDFLLG